MADSTRSADTVSSCLTRPSTHYNRPMRTLSSTAVAATLVSLLPLVLAGQTPAPATVTILKPARVFDGDTVHDGWSVRVRGDRIDAVGADASVATAGAKVIELA